MKKSLTLFMVLILIFSIASIAEASGAPRRVSTQVKDVFEPYTADSWIISPEEEPLEDQKVTNAIECDIEGVISCYDHDYFRVDLLLANSITYDWDVWYAVKLEYDNCNEYFTYFTDTEKLVYEKEVNGKITETKELTEDNADDYAGVTDSGENHDNDVYFIINKRDHLAGKEEKRYFLTSCFLTGYIDAKGKPILADDTKIVDLEFEF